MNSRLVFYLLSLISIFNIPYVRSNELLKTDSNNFLSDTLLSTVYYLTLHPGIVDAKDTTAIVHLSSKFAAPVHIFKGSELIRGSIISKQNDFISIGLKSEEIQSTVNYEFKSKSEKPTVQLFQKSAIKIVATKSPDAVCYLKTKYGNHSDGTKLIAVSNLGKSYQVALPNKTRHLDSIPANYISIISVHKNTYITVKLGGTSGSYVRLEDGTDIKIGESFTQMMNDGDVLLIPALGNANISGTLIYSSTVFGVISGSNRAYIKDSTLCNYTVSQELPMEEWGGHSLVPTIADRNEYPEVKVFTGQKENTLSINGELAWSISSVGGQKGLGYVDDFLGHVSKEYPYPFPVVMTSEKPFNIVVTNPGNFINKSARPIQFNITPTQNFVNSAVFKIEDPENDNLIFVFKAEKDGSIPNDILISNVVDGEVKWAPLVSVSPNPGTKFFGIYSDSTHFRAKSIELMKGTFSIKSPVPFCIYQIGTHQSDYAFDLSGEVNEYKYNDIFSPEIEFDKCKNCDIEGQVIEEPRIDPLNCSRIAFVSLDNSKSYNVRLDVSQFDNKKALSVNWKLSVISPNLKARAYLIAIDNKGNRKDTVIEIVSIKPTLSTSKINFGTINIKSDSKELSKTLKLKLENSADLSNDYEMYLLLDSDGNDNKENDIIEYQHFDFIDLRNINILPLIQNGEIDIKISFGTAQKGVFKDSLGIIILEKVEGSAPKPVSLMFLTELDAISGSNTLKTENYSFGNIKLNDSNVAELNIMNNEPNADETALPLIITGIELLGTDIGFGNSDMPIKVYDIDNISEQSPLVIHPKESRKFKVKFSPLEQRSYSGTIEFISDNKVDINKSIVTGLGILTSVANSTESKTFNIFSNNNEIYFRSVSNVVIDRIEIYNLDGELIYSESVNKFSNDYTLNQNQFAAGVYIIKIIMNGDWISDKIIIN